MKQFKWFHLGATFLLVLFYNNCSDYKGSDTVSQNSGQCTSKVATALEKSSFKAEESCFDLDLVACETRIFSPEVQNSISVEETCLDHEVYGELCMDLSARSYDTRGAEGSPEDFAEGGPYNYQEYNCHLKKHLSDGKAIFTSSGDSLTGALDQLHKNCLGEG